MKRELLAVRQAVVNRNQAEARYLHALRKAKTKCSLAEIAEAAGESRQTIHYTLKKETP